MSNRLTIQEIILKSGNQELPLDSSRQNVRGRLFNSTSIITTGNIQLNRSSETFQFIDPSGANISVFLPTGTGWQNDDFYSISHIGASGIIEVQDQAGVLEQLYPQDLISIINRTGQTQITDYNFALNPNTDLISVNASGTPYTVTTTMTGINFSGVNPDFTVPRPGVWDLNAMIIIDSNGVSNTGQKTLSVKLRRVNNTPADIGQSIVSLVGDLSSVSRNIANVKIQEYYETLNDDDDIQVWASISDSPGTGVFLVSQAQIRAGKIG